MVSRSSLAARRGARGSSIGSNIGRSALGARVERAVGSRPVSDGAMSERAQVAARPNSGWRRRAGVADVQGFLNGRKRDFGRVFDLLGIVRHVQSEPSLLLRIPASLAQTSPRKLEAGIMPSRGAKRARGRLVRYIRKHPIG